MKEAILQQKQGIVEDIKTKFETCKSAVLIDYRGLTVEEVTNLRNKFREAGVEYRVLKNTMIRRAVDALGMEGLEPGWVKRVHEGDIIVAEDNFGCGSSREHAPIAIKASGISLVIANSFARIFYRNSINIGLPILECPEAVKNIKAGDVVSCDLAKGEIVNETTGKTFQAEPFPEFIQNIIDKGGLIASIKAAK